MQTCRVLNGQLILGAEKQDVRRFRVGRERGHARVRVQSTAAYTSNQPTTEPWLFFHHPLHLLLSILCFVCPLFHSFPGSALTSTHRQASSNIDAEALQLRSVACKARLKLCTALFSRRLDFRTSSRSQVKALSATFVCSGFYIR
jgi:hypothetical protein